MTGNDPAYLVTALHKFYTGRKLPKSKHETYKPLPNMKPAGAFLLNPEGFFSDKSTDIGYKAQYIRLAGRRDYSLYKTYSIKSLDLSLYPDINLGAIRHNPLLTIAKNHIYFKFEELYNGTELQTNKR